MKAIILTIALMLCTPAIAGSGCHILPQDEIRAAFVQLHTLSEQLYDGNGSWGYAKTGYRMALRDSAWRAEVYGNIADISPLYHQRAIEAANYLVKAQQEGSSGVFGMPADLKNPEFGSRIQQVTQHCPNCIHNGWIISLPDKHMTELYYDHGFALSSLVNTYMRSGDTKWLTAIRQGADWAMGKAPTDNINYLSTLSKGLSLAASATGDQQYLERAVYLQQHYILPNLTVEGEARDKHNTRLEYHAFIVSGLVALRQSLPTTHTFSSKLDQALSATTARLTMRSLKDPATDKDSWPGAVLMAWHDIASLRSLTTSELQSLNRALTLASRQVRTATLSKNVFHKQKSLYINFSIGYFMQESPACK